MARHCRYRSISGDFLAPRFVDARGLTVRIALVGHSATLLAGDDLRIEFVVAPGTCLEVIDLADVFKVLETEGVDKFEVSWNELLDATAEQLRAATQKS